ncbi:MAG: hypothetical protein R2824_14805 [Saprospiraceae bacterium]|nr:hypothetical protein [Lewinella sp.]
MTQQCITLDQPQEWQKALEHIPHSFFHTWEYCRALSLTDGQDSFLYRFEHEDCRIVCPLHERSFSGQLDLVTPYGFSGFTGTGYHPEFPEHWEKFVKSQKYICGYLGLNPILEPAICFPENNYYSHNATYVLDLSRDTMQIYAGMSQNRRRQVRKGDQHLHLYEREQLIRFFLENYHDFMEQKQAAGVYRFSQETLRSMLASENMMIVGAGRPDRVEAVSLFAYTPYVADFLFNVSIEEGRQHSVALIWHALQQLRSLGIPWLNLGGGVRENDSLAEFKARFGATKQPLKALKQIYDPTTYRQLCLQVQTDPEDMAGYFPAYRK